MNSSIYNLNAFTCIQYVNYSRSTAAYKSIFIVLIEVEITLKIDNEIEAIIILFNKCYIKT